MRVCPRCANETELAECPRDGALTIAVQQGIQTYPAGTVIAERYRVEKALGIGGFGAVYLCTQLAMEQRVAVKVLRSEHLSSAEHVKRFTREAQAVSRLKHPNTIHIFDFGVHQDGALYLAMEYLEGETLADRLDRHRHLPWRDLVHIAVQICHSLTEAHASGLVHRDLKPENIMLMSVAGDPNFVKVLDFGIAKVQDPNRPKQSNLTEAGMIMGTPTYMSPEQAKGEDIDARSDVYALGVMLYEALTGRPPFADETAMKVLVAHIKDQPKPFARTKDIADVPAQLERVVLQCLAKEPLDRPQTAAILAELLRNSTMETTPAVSLPVVEPAERPVLAGAMAAVGGGKVPLPAAPAVYTAPQPAASDVARPASLWAAGAAPRATPAPSPAGVATVRQHVAAPAEPAEWALPRPPLSERSPSTQLAMAGAAAPFASPIRVPAPTLKAPRKPAVIGAVVFLSIASVAVVAVALLAPNTTQEPSGSASSGAPSGRDPAAAAGAEADAPAPPAAVEPPPVPRVASPQALAAERPSEAQRPPDAPPAAAKPVPAAAALAKPDASSSGRPVAARVEPTKVESGKVEPAKVEPAKVEPAKVEPAKVEPAKVEPAKVEPAKVEPPKADPTKPKPDDFRLED